jgi:uncharacterized protein (TIGR02118 family)
MDWCQRLVCHGRRFRLRSTRPRTTSILSTWTRRSPRFRKPALPTSNLILPGRQAYWAEHHGPLFSHTPDLRRYVQHITLTEAYGGTPAPTHDGVSMFWYDTMESVIHPPQSPRLIDIIPQTHTATFEWYVRAGRYGSPASMTLAETVVADDRQLFDRSTEWPTDHRRSNVTATERLVLEGTPTSTMVKAIFMVARRPGLTVEEFQEHWFGEHGRLVAQLPGLRRYVQNHAVQAAYGLPGRPMTHDGFSELWFDDLAQLQLAATTPQWRAAKEDGKRLFAEPLGLVIARERVQKEMGLPIG